MLIERNCRYDKWLKKNIWKDPVWSKIIATGIITLIAYFYHKLTTIKTEHDAEPYTDSGLSDILNKISGFFQEGFGLYIKYAIWLILAIIFVVCIIRLIKGILLKRKFNAFKSATFWRANFKWKWTKYGSDFNIEYADIQKICPSCNHDLAFDKADYYITLKCNNCRFVSDIFYSSSSPFDYSVFVLPNKEPQVFYIEFRSKINAGLRQRNLL